MDSSPVLRQQSHNTIRTDILRTKSEQNKIPADPKSPKVLSTLQSLQHNIENQDPGSSALVRPPNVRPCVSRLPVLAKSIHLQTPSDFTHSHCKWEEKPLTGKAKAKKPCTRPVPFNLSQPRTARLASKNQQPHTVLQTRTSKPEQNVFSSQLKTKNKSLKHSATCENGTFTKVSENISQPLGQSGCSNLHKTSAKFCVSKSSSSASNTAKNSAPASEQLSLGAEACSENMNRLTLSTPSNTKGSSNKIENFDINHAALLSILRNEGVTSFMTPHNNLPGRVSVMKSRQKAEPNSGHLEEKQNEGVKALAPSDIATPQRVPVKKNCAEPFVGPVGSVKRVQFSPDAAALQSILQNEGVKAGDGATQRNSVCPSGRGTSIYMAQRVPVRKNRAETNGGPVALKESLVQKWTPQRVTRHQPMSTMKWHTMSQQSPYSITPGLKSCKANLCTKREEVVQRLFDDQDEQTIDQGFEPQTESLPDQTSSIKTHNEEKIQSIEGTEPEEKGQMEQEERVVEQPFIQALERESVIFFSTGKKMFRDARFKKPDIQANNEQCGPEETLPVLQQSCRIKTALQSLPKDIFIQKTSAVNPAVAILRKRFPPLEELRLDAEVATYTAVSEFYPLRPRCGNPLASILHYEESIRFVPISFDMTFSEPDSSHKW